MIPRRLFNVALILLCMCGGTAPLFEFSGSANGDRQNQPTHQMKPGVEGQPVGQLREQTFSTASLTTSPR